MTHTQIALVRSRLTRHGLVTNGWALSQRPPITRLAARIADLRAEGLAIETEYNTKRTGRNAHYRLTRIVSTDE